MTTRCRRRRFARCISSLGNRRWSAWSGQAHSARERLNDAVRRSRAPISCSIDAAPSSVDAVTSLSDTRASPSGAAVCSIDPAPDSVGAARVSRDATQCSSDAALDARVPEHRFQGKRNADATSRNTVSRSRRAMPGHAARVSSLATRVSRVANNDARCRDARFQASGEMS